MRVSLRLWPQGVSHLHSSPHSDSRNLSKLPFKCMAVATLVLGKWVLTVVSYIFLPLCFSVQVCPGTSILWERLLIFSLFSFSFFFSFLRMAVTISKLFTHQNWNWKLFFTSFILLVLLLLKRIVHILLT